MKKLLVTTKDIKRHTIINGSVDPDNFVHYVNIAQEIHIQNFLGTDLYVKFQELIEDNSINDVANVKYKSLLEDYVAPMVIHWTSVEYMPFAAVVLTNKGIYKTTSENAVELSSEELESLIEKQRGIAQHYTDRFISFMCNNSADFPEYSSNTGEDVYPDTDGYYNGLYLG